MTAPFNAPAGLTRLAQVYVEAGHEIWLVGGCVRDHILGQPAKDIDLATSATPEEQIALCEANDYHWIGTGLQHGTITVVVDSEPYEITTFRTDVETDGRHAVVEYTRSLLVDLERRDLTMNAIAMSVLTGEIVDPFGGVEDALKRNVRFVGVPADRIREDYLRILRWFRFLGRFEGAIDITTVDAMAIRDNAAGLSRISVERVWSEMQKILTGPKPADIINMMGTLGVLAAINLPTGNTYKLGKMRSYSFNPAVLLTVWLEEASVGVAKDWKMSNAERETVDFVLQRITTHYDINIAKRDLVDEHDRDIIMSLLMIRGKVVSADVISHWQVPVFPVAGKDLIANGMKPGPAVGARLKAMREAWIQSDYVLRRDELLAIQ